MGKIGKKMRIIRIRLENIKKSQVEITKLNNMICEIKVMYEIDSRLEGIEESVNLKTDF